MPIGTTTDIPKGHFSGGAHIAKDVPEDLETIMNRMRSNIGAIREGTTENIDLWVSTTGNDTTGDGSQGSPYATLKRALDEIPLLNINHFVHVRMAPGEYDLPDMVMAHGLGGILAIEGTGTPTVVAGPISVTSAASSSNNSYYTITVTGAGWSNDQWYQKWVRVTAGTAAGAIWPIYSNDSDEIIIYNAFGRGTVTEIEIIDGPTVTLTTPGCSICVNGAYPGLAFGNIRLKTTEWQGINIEGNFYFGFCVLEGQNPVTDPWYTPLTIKRTEINSGALPAGFSFDESQYSAESTLMIARGTAPVTGTYAWGISHTGGTSRLNRISCRFNLDSRWGHEVISFCAFGSLRIFDAASLNVSYALFDPVSIAWADGVILVNDITKIILNYAYINPRTTAGDAIEVYPSSRLYMKSVEGDASQTPGYGVRVFVGAKITLDSGVTLTGTTNDMYFEQTSTASAWPASGNAVTDSQGSFVAAL